MKAAEQGRKLWPEQCTTFLIEMETLSNVFVSDEDKTNALLLIFPYAQVKRGSLGGHTSITVYVSLDPREWWINGIYHNSRYSIFSISDGKMEQIARHHKVPKFRKCKIKDFDHVVSKLMEWK